MPVLTPYRHSHEGLCCLSLTKSLLQYFLLPEQDTFLTESYAGFSGVQRELGKVEKRCWVARQVTNALCDS